MSQYAIIDIDNDIRRKAHEAVHFMNASGWLQRMFCWYDQGVSSKKFQNSTVKVKLSKSGMQNEVKIRSDILSTLISLSTHHKAPLDFEAAMAYPLTPVSPALWNADESIRKTKKSSLYEAAMAELVVLNPEYLPPKEELSTYLFDEATAIRLQLKNCEMIKQLAWRILSSVPKQVDTVWYLSI